MTIVVMEICKAPTSRLKTLNKHSTHIIVHRDRECYPKVKKQLHNVHTNGSNRAMYHIVHTDIDERHCCLTEIFGKEKCLEFAFEESSRVPGV